MCFCYVLYSQSLDRFYTGSTILNLTDRLKKHLSQYYGKNKFTSGIDDWTIYLEIPCESIDQARKIELHIKRMKSSRYIRNLKVYPELVIKLKHRFAK